MKVAIVYKVYIEGELDEVVMRTFKNANPLKLFWKKLKEEHRQYDDSYSFEYFTVNKCVALPPPPDFELGSDHWCPYCRSPRLFIENSNRDVRECNVCSISDRDFYVRKYNLLDPTWEEIQRMRRKQV